MSDRRDEEACFGEYIKRRALLRFNRENGYDHLLKYETKVCRTLEEWYPNFPALYGKFVREWKSA